jgi:uncharacterized protein (DUF58 family)
VTLSLSSSVVLSPDTRLLVALGTWVIGAAASVVFPALDWALAISGCVLAAAVAADALSLLASEPLELERRARSRLEVGGASEVRVAVRNPRRRRVVADVFDEVPRDLVAEDPYFEAVRIEPGETRELAYRVSPRVRGDRELGALAALERAPLGLLRRRVLAAAGQVVRVYPDTRRFLVPEALSPHKVLASLGVKPSPQRGEGTEFESLRDYVPGDDPRRMDWRATARRGRFVTRLLQHERNHTVMIAVDASRLMGGRIGERTKLDCAVDAALALAWSALHAGDRAGLVVFDRELRHLLGPRARRVHLGAFVEALAPVDSRLVEADYRVLVGALLGRGRRRALVVVLTDFAESDATALVTPLALLARRHRVLLVALRDHRFLRIEQDAGDPYERIVLDDLLREREETLARLRLQGVHTLDLVSEAVTASVLNRYLAMRYGAV